MSFTSFIKSYRYVLLTITTGYLLILVGLAYVGTHINNDIRILESQTHNLYQHPFQVNGAAREARQAASMIRIELLYALAVRGKVDHSDLAKKINAYDVTLNTSLSTIEANFLGDMSKVSEARELIVLWKKERAPLVNLLEKERDAEAEILMLTTSGPTYKKLSSRLDYIIDSSSKKAAFFSEEADQKSKAALARFQLLLGGFALFESPRVSWRPVGLSQTDMVCSVSCR